MKRRILLSIAITCSALLTFSQSLDEERMDRDLKIAENILNTIMDGGDRFYRNNKVESNYIPDYGVIFSIPRNQLVIYAKEGKEKILYSGRSEIIIADVDSDAEVEVKDIKKLDSEKLQKEIMEKMKAQISDFLIDYADLIGQLKPSDRIVVQLSGSRNDLFFIEDGRKKSQGNFSGQILKSDLTSYKQGKMEREDAVAKIEWDEGGDGEVAKDIELFASIFAALYEPDISSTYYTSSRRIGYTRLENFGVTFKMKVYSSSSDGGKHRIRTTGQGGLSQEERDEIVNAMYPEFEKSFKENLIDYGRTIRSINPNEMVLFKVALTECKGCEMPEAIEVSVSGKILKDYDAGSISKEKALEQVNVKKKRG